MKQMPEGRGFGDDYAKYDGNGWGNGYPRGNGPETYSGTGAGLGYTVGDGVSHGYNLFERIYYPYKQMVKI
jgi:hypothetical protein